MCDGKRTVLCVQASVVVVGSSVLMSCSVFVLCFVFVHHVSDFLLFGFACL